MSTTNTIHRCYCNHTIAPLGKFECMAYVRGNVAYALDALPQTHVEAVTGTPWAQSTIYLCGTHHNTFIKGKALALTNTINTAVQEDNIMNTTTIHTDDYDAECSFDNALAELEGQPYTTHSGIYGNVLIENCQHDHCIEVYNETMWEMQGEVCCGETPCNHYSVLLCTHHVPKEETMTTNTNAVIKNQMDQMVLCGNCKNYHHTVAEVKDCYRNNGKITHESAPTNTTTVKDPENYKWFATMPEAIAFAKGKDASVKRASNGNGVVVHLR